MSQPTPRNVTVVRKPRTPRTPISSIGQSIHTFLYNWGVAKDAGTERDRARDRIKKWFESGGNGEFEVTYNENGSPAIEFDEPMEIGGRKIRGLENRRTVTTDLDLEAIDEWLEGLPADQREKLSAQLFHREVVFTLKPDVLFQLNQDGVIKDDVLDSFQAVRTTYSLNVLLA